MSMSITLHSMEEALKQAQREQREVTEGVGTFDRTFLPSPIVRPLEDGAFVYTRVDVSHPREDRDIAFGFGSSSRENPETASASPKSFPPEIVGQAFHDALATIGKDVSKYQAGSTFTGAAILSDGSIVAAQIGDSRAWALVIEGDNTCRCVRLTPTHAYSARGREKEMARVKRCGGIFGEAPSESSGKMRLNQILGVTRALGHHPLFYPTDFKGLSMAPDISFFKMPENIKHLMLIVATDGLTDVADEKTIEDIATMMVTHPKDVSPKDFPECLTQLLNQVIEQRFAYDDITFLVAPILLPSSCKFPALNSPVLNKVFAVADGHLGSKTSGHIKKHFPEQFCSELTWEILKRKRLSEQSNALASSWMFRQRPSTPPAEKKIGPQKIEPFSQSEPEKGSSSVLASRRRSIS